MFKHSRFFVVIISCLLITSCVSPLQGRQHAGTAGGRPVTTLVLPFWHWRFHISDTWRIQQQSNLFDVKEDMGEQAFRRQLKQNQGALFTLTPNDQRPGSNVLTLVASLLPLKGRSTDTKAWLVHQVEALSSAYSDFKVDEPAHWIGTQKRWVKIRFSFANPDSDSAPRVQSVFWGTIANGSGLIVALADPTGQPLDNTLLKEVPGMIELPE